MFLRSEKSYADAADAVTVTAAVCTKSTPVTVGAVRRSVSVTESEIVAKYEGSSTSESPSRR